MLTGHPPGVSCATREPAPGDRLDAWQRALSRTFVDIEVTVEHDRPWTGELAAERLGALQIATEEFGPGTILRGARSVAADPRTHILVRRQVEGTALLLQDGRTAQLHPGGLAFHDARRPFRIVLPERQRARILMVPRALLRLEEWQLRALTATVVDDAGGGAAGLLLPLLDGLVDEVIRATPTRREQLARTIVGILSTVALEQAGGQPESALWERITASVRTRLGESGLAPQDIADQHAISLRYLHRLFQRQGTTVGAWVRTRRLEAAREELARPGAAHRSIAAVAARWGFTSPSHFSRAFRETYGMSPAQWRRAAGAVRAD
ncbi:helix-turn-helix domain-containing protein [Streptomyces sp. 4503]|uniref:Helix-turn-helix domain-containing protein n=1 Tax=Streptomyces niphimycinicus TaxID=2842201 RepID=A0ABS6CV05_9ACTN|nr:helix-turn-helix domain-containing protein [Streptomyces niphimycinicus]MBU3870732.1 helix-turn-helix domain-containing protein [Streptomyces niphimycinicus]